MSEPSAAPASARPERNTGIRSILSLAPIYRLVQSAVGAQRFRKILVSEILRPGPGERILDIGCGTADILDHLSEVDYHGFDPNPRYIESAAERFGSRATFETASIQEHSTPGTSPRSLAIAIGVLHHLDDDAAEEVLRLAAASLEPGGRFVSIDPTLVDGQNPLARLAIKNDRGQHVRTPEQLQRLVGSRADHVSVQVRHDLLRIPYTHAVVEATLRRA